MAGGRSVPKLPGGYYFMLYSRSPKYSVQDIFSIILEACAEADCCDAIARELAGLQYVKPCGFTPEEFARLSSDDRFVKVHPPASIINEILGRSGMDADKFKNAFEVSWDNQKTGLAPEKPVLREVKPHVKRRYKRRPGIFSRHNENDTISAHSAAEAAGDAIKKIANKPHADIESKPDWINPNLVRLVFKYITLETYCELEDCAESTARIRLKKYVEYARKVYKRTVEE